MGFVIFIHALVCVFLCLIILMQSGRGGGLTESFSSAESIFGAKTNVFLVKATTVLGSIFLVTCLSLAFFSSKQDKSLMSKRLNPAPTSTMNTTPVAPSSSQDVSTDTKESTQDANQNSTQAPAVTNSVQ